MYPKITTIEDSRIFSGARPCFNIEFDGGFRHSHDDSGFEDALIAHFDEIEIECNVNYPHTNDLERPVMTLQSDELTEKSCRVEYNKFRITYERIHNKEPDTTFADRVWSEKKGY